MRADYVRESTHASRESTHGNHSTADGGQMDEAALHTETLDIRAGQRGMAAAEEKGSIIHHEDSTVDNDRETSGGAPQDGGSGTPWQTSSPFTFSQSVTLFPSTLMKPPKGLL